MVVFNSTERNELFVEEGPATELQGKNFFFKKKKKEAARSSFFLNFVHCSLLSVTIILLFVTRLCFFLLSKACPI